MKRAVLLLAAAPGLMAQALSGHGPANVLVVVNDSSLLSRRIAQYYVRKRAIPLANVCHLNLTIDEEIPREVYVKGIEAPVAAFLREHKLQQTILYIVTTLGLPLKVAGTGDNAMVTTAAAVDSELTLLYAKMAGMKPKESGIIPNPFFGKRDAPFEHPQFPMYLVTRLAGYDFEDVKGIVDRSLGAVNRGKFVIDLRSSGDPEGDNWLRAAAKALPADRLVLEQSEKVLYGEKDVIAFAGWGSNDPNRHRRLLGFQWLPGAIATEFVSTNGRTFQRPAESWNISTWSDKAHFFAGAPQTLTADTIHEGATGCSGHVYEPYLAGCPRPDMVLPAYYSGRNLAESYYLGIRGLSWQNIVVGDPLCRLRTP